MILLRILSFILIFLYFHRFPYSSSSIPSSASDIDFLSPSDRFFLFAPRSSAVRSISHSNSYSGAEILKKSAIKRLRCVNYQPAPVEISLADRDNSEDLFSSSYRHLHERDLPLIRLLGANCIRLYGWDERVDHTDFLDLCAKYELFVILTFQPSFGYLLGSFDVSDSRPAQRQSIHRRFREFVNRYQNHSSVIMYFIGNEPNSRTGHLGNFFQLVTELSAIRDSECESWLINSGSQTSVRRSSFSSVSSLSCWHPISVPLGDRVAASGVDLVSQAIPLERYYPRAVDVWSFQLFRGSTFGSFFNQYARFQKTLKSNKPTFIAEFGADAMDFRSNSGAPNETSQSSSLISQWRELNAAPASLCIGGSIFEWTDEYWRGTEFTSPARECSLVVRKLREKLRSSGQLDGSLLSRSHSICGRIGPADDKFLSESWFGLNGLVSGPGAELQCIKPRLAIAAVAKVWGADPMKAICRGEECCAARSNKNSIILPLIFLCALAFSICYWNSKRRNQQKLEKYKSKDEIIKRNSADSDSTGMKPISHFPPLDSASLSALQSSIRSNLLVYFEEIISRSNYSTFSEYSQLLRLHSLVQVDYLSLMILQQLLRTNFNLQLSIHRVFIRIMESYRSWCKFTGNKSKLRKSIKSAIPMNSINASSSGVEFNNINNKDFLFDLAEYLLFWSMSDHLRRVPGFVNSQFQFSRRQQNSNGIGSNGSSNDGAGAALIKFRELSILMQNSIEKYQFNFDDADQWSGKQLNNYYSSKSLRLPTSALTLASASAPASAATSATEEETNNNKIISSSSSNYYLNLFKNFLFPRRYSFPRFSGWLGILLNFYIICHFHVLLFVAVLELVDSPIRLARVSADKIGENSKSSYYYGLLDYYSVYSSARGIRLILALAQWDFALIAIHQIFSLLTCFRISAKQCGILLGSLFGLILMKFPLLPPILLSLMGNIIIPFSPELIAGFILLIRVFWLILFSLRRAWRAQNLLNRSDLLPGSYSEPDILINLHTNFTIDHPAINSRSADSSSSSLEPMRSLNAAISPNLSPIPHNIYFRFFRSFSAFLRNLLLWGFIFSVKLLFDTYVLWPSVAGVTKNSLCGIRENENFDSASGLVTVGSGALSLGFNSHLLAAVDISAGSEAEFSMNPSLPMLDSSILARFACPTFVSLLWIVTFLMSLATTYVSYMIGLSGFGFLLPILFRGAFKWERKYLFLLFTLFWLSVIIALLSGAFWTAMKMALFFIFLSLAMDFKWNNYYQNNNSMEKLIKEVNENYNQLNNLNHSSASPSSSSVEQLFLKQTRNAESSNSRGNSTASTAAVDSLSIGLTPILIDIQYCSIEFSSKDSIRPVISSLNCSPSNSLDSNNMNSPPQTIIQIFSRALEFSRPELFNPLINDSSFRELSQIGFYSLECSREEIKLDSSAIDENYMESLSVATEIPLEVLISQVETVRIHQGKIAIIQCLGNNQNISISEVFNNSDQKDELPAAVEFHAPAAMNKYQRLLFNIIISSLAIRRRIVILIPSAAAATASELNSTNNNNDKGSSKWTELIVQPSEFIDSNPIFFFLSRYQQNSDSLINNSHSISSGGNDGGSSVKFRPLISFPPLIASLHRRFQQLSSQSLSYSQTKLIWNKISQSIRESDLLSNYELNRFLSIQTEWKFPFLPISNPEFLLSLSNHEVNRRLEFFFQSFEILQQKNRLKLDKIHQTRSLSVIIPIYNETVYFTIADLLSDSPNIHTNNNNNNNNNNSNHSSMPMDSSSNLLYQSTGDQISLIEYFIERYSDEWENFCERMKEMEWMKNNNLIPNHSILLDNLSPPQYSIHNSSKIPLNSFSQFILYSFISVGCNELTPNSLGFTSAQWFLLVNEIIDWSSNRGQTLARTIRGLNNYKSVIELWAELEGQGNATAGLSEQKLQILVSAQLFGTSSVAAALQRQSFRRLLKKFPHVEIVYDLPQLSQLSSSPSPQQPFSFSGISVEKKSKDEKTDESPMPLSLSSDFTDSAAIFRSILNSPHYRYFSVHIKLRRELTTSVEQMKFFDPPEPIKFNPINEFDEILHVLPRDFPLLLGSLDGIPSTSALPRTNGKSENQLHSLPFARGEILQTIDMNQDFAFEEALKYRWLIQEFQFQSNFDQPRFQLVGAPEFIFTGSMGAVARYMALQDTSFVTIVQRVLNFSGARLHYGHPDCIEGFWARFHIGLSKASPEINLSEDFFYGVDQLMRGGRSNYAEFIQYGKGRETSLINSTIFESKLARGATLLMKSPDLYGLVYYSLDSLSSLSLLFGSTGHYFYTLLFDLTITSFCWIILLMSVSRVNEEQIGILGSVYSIPWLFHLGYLFGAPLLFQLILEYGFLLGLWNWLKNLLFGSIYYLFQLRTKSSAIQDTIAFRASANYAGTGRGIQLSSHSLLELYKLFSLTHFHHSLHLLSLLCIYIFIFSDDQQLFFSILLKIYAILFACFSWLTAPIFFNPLIPLPRLGEQYRECLRWCKAEFLTSAAASGLAIVADSLLSGSSGVASMNSINSASWLNWDWQNRINSIELKFLRYSLDTASKSTAAGKGISNELSSAVNEEFRMSIAFGSFFSRPFFSFLSDLFFTLLYWFPWLFVFSALLEYISLGGTIILLICSIGVLLIHYFTPTRFHLPLIISILFLFHSAIQFDILHSNPYKIILSDIQIAALPEPRRGFSLSILLLTYFLLCILIIQSFIADIILIAVDYLLLRQVSTRPAILRYYRTGRQLNSTDPITDPRPFLLIFLTERRLLFSYQFIHRMLLPMATATIHISIAWIISKLYRSHCNLLMEIDWNIHELIRNNQRLFVSAIRNKEKKTDKEKENNKGKERNIKEHEGKTKEI